MKWMVKKLLFLLCIVFLLNGCLQKEILDEVNLIDGIGFDDAEDGKIKGTATMSVYLKDQKPENKTFTSESEIKKTILQNIQRQAADPIVTGNIELVLFSKKLASEKGILELVDPFQRDPGVGSGIFLAIVEGEVEEFLNGDYGIAGNAKNISTSIKTNMEREDLPKTNLQRFLSDFYQTGKTPYLPQIKQISKTNADLNGVCFFKHGKVIHTIPPEKMFFFKLLVDKFSEGLHQVEMEEGKAAIQSIRSSNKFKLTKRDPYEVVIKIKVDGIINEYTGNDLSSKDIPKMEKAFEKEINEKSMELINEFRDKRLDPIGFGKFVKTKTRRFDINEWWDHQYDELTIKVHSDVTIVEAGVIQ